MSEKQQGDALEILGDVVSFFFGLFLTAYMIAFFFVPWLHTDAPDIAFRALAMTGGALIVALGLNRWIHDLKPVLLLREITLDWILVGCGAFIILHNVLYFWWPSFSVGEPSLVIRSIELGMGLGIMALSAYSFRGDVNLKTQPPG